MYTIVTLFQFYKGVSMDEGVFVGGAPSRIDAIESKVGTGSGFHGCIRKVRSMAAYLSVFPVPVKGAFSLSSTTTFSWTQRMR